MLNYAGMMELVDMLALGASTRKSVGVQISLPAPGYSKGFLSLGGGGLYVESNLSSLIRLSWL